METCYLCEEKLVKPDKTNLTVIPNVSKEHIILNSIGGRLHSYTLLCKICNSTFGSQCDKELSGQLSNLSSLLQIKRDDGEIQDIIGTGEDGLQYRLIKGFRPVMAKPKMSINGNMVSYSTSSTTAMNKFMNSLGRKVEGFDVESAKKKIVQKQAYIKPITFTDVIGSELAFKSITKTAVNYYIEQTKDREQVKHLFKYLKNEEEKDVAFHFHSKKPLYQKTYKDEVVHLLHIVGNKYTKMLYCYVEFFSSSCFIVKLSENYSGENINSTYCYDVLKNQVINIELDLHLSRARMKEIFRKNIAYNKPLVTKLDRIIKIAQEIQNQMAFKEMVEQTAKQLCIDYNVDTSDEAVKRRIYNVMYNKLMEYKKGYRQFQNQINQ